MTSKKSSQLKKIALFGGKFDPPHLAHQITIFLLLNKYLMDEVWVIPSFGHPFGCKSTSFEIRMKMCSFLIKPWENSGQVIIRDDEKNVGTTPVYTIDLLKHIIQKNGENEYYLAIGEDNWNIRHQWKNFNEIETLATPVIIGRGDKNFQQFFPLPDISSSIIRNMIREGISPEHLLPCGLYEYLIENRITDEYKK